MDIMVIQVFSLCCSEITIFRFKLGVNGLYFRQTATIFKKLEDLWVRIMNLGGKEKNGLSII